MWRFVTNVCPYPSTLHNILELLSYCISYVTLAEIYFHDITLRSRMNEPPAYFFWKKNPTKAAYHYKDPSTY